MSPKNHPPADYAYEFDSPFLTEELFAPESEEEWEPRASALVSESPFQSAFEPGRGGFDSPETEGPRSFDEGRFLEGEEPGVINNTRRRVTPTVGVPLRWICKVEVKDWRSGKPLEPGTGVLISNRHILTAAHVVYDAARNMQKFSIEVTPALDKGVKPFETRLVSAKPRLPVNYKPGAADQTDWDYALLKLDTAIGEKTFPALKGNPLCYWGSRQCGANTVFAPPDPATLNRKSMLIAGYPTGKGGGLEMWCATGVLLGVAAQRRTMDTTADMTKGQSGSPVWVVENKLHCLVGIAVAVAPRGLNVVLRLTPDMFRQLKDWIKADGETLSMRELRETLEAPASVASLPEAERHERPFAGWSPEPSAEEAEDFADADYEEEQLALLHEQPLEEQFDLSNVPKDVADALVTRVWPVALKLAIQAGCRDENELTNLIFFALHPELPRGKVDPKHPRLKQLRDEWSNILRREVRPYIYIASEDTDLKVTGSYVAERDRLFSGERGKKLKELVEWAAKEADINPGLLAAAMLAELDERWVHLYLNSGEVSSFDSGADDFYAKREQLRANVPAFSKVSYDKINKTIDTNEGARKVTTVRFKSGRDAVLATAVYLKNGEVVIRKGAKRNGGDFDALPVETRFALVRIAMAAGHGGINPDGDLLWYVRKGNKWVEVPEGTRGASRIGVASRLEKVLKGEDILVRKYEPRKYPSTGHITNRNATILVAQAMHLSDWFFGLPLKAAAAQPELEAFEGFDEAEFGDDEFGDDEFEDDAEAYDGDIDPELAGEVEHPDHEAADDAPSFEMLVPQVSLADLRTRIDEYFNLAKASYILKSGTAVSARPQFRQAAKGDPEPAIKRVSLILGKAFEESHPKAIRMAAYGRAKPAEIAAITQALIDAGKLPAVSAVNPGFDNEQLVRALQREFKMGIDCAGYVQLAFIFAFTGSDDDPPSVRRSLGLHERRGWERLEALPGGHFTKVAVVDAQTGDLFVMRPRAGSGDNSWHTVIIVDHTSSDTVHTFLCDASWGTDLYGVTAGGVARRKLKHNTETGEWWDVHPLNGSDAHKNTTGPYNGHPIHGMFRAKPKK